ncbi:hypothetical protein HIM_04104 [Hirsutella minnesotensis 3608]|uniref:Uncharacterized protein n=1 Tax=Hirsutella minnesotensis 3608 TaxID=1043627 RepID=A0A0F7ZPZ8_9HYPO|nr:hypothetical protein HIM_04104 [Hirsutella minnesotensis 3608]
MASQEQEQNEAQGTPSSFRLSDAEQWASALLRTRACRRPLLAHLNADTSWLLQLPWPASHPSRPPGRTHFNILIDPWLRGPQSDVASWFSTQWHVVAPSFDTVAELDGALRDIERRILATSAGDGVDGRPLQNVAADAVSGETSHIDAVAVSHEFTDHCHQKTLLELSRQTPVFAPQVAADLIRGWGHFDNVITAPALEARDDWSALAAAGSLPDWLSIGRLVSPGNALYYHSAMVFVLDLGEDAAGDREAVIYSPHGVQSRDLEGIQSSGLRPLALLHGLHEIHLPAKQLNLGALNGIEAIAASRAKYWIPSHDEVKKGGGLIAPFLRRTRYSLKEAISHQEKRLGETSGSQSPPQYHFIELASGDALCME